MLAGLPPDLIATPHIRDLFADRAILQSALDVEAALALAQARCGIFARAKADAILAASRVDQYDADAVALAALRSGTFIVPLVEAMKAKVGEIDHEAVNAVHFGATSQDIADTGFVLQVRKASHAVLADAARLEIALAGFAENHASTPMLGRTLLQPAVPISFGLKAAGWLQAIERGHKRVESAVSQCCVLQLGGAAGTLATLGGKGLAVQRELASGLGLAVPDMPWHAHRDRMAALGAAIAIMIGSIAKIARDISLMSQFEVGEVAEPASRGRGGSSSMPYKRNPVGCAIILAAHARAPHLAAQLIANLDHEHERSLGQWHAEPSVLVELFYCMSGALSAAIEILEGLTIFPDAMRNNLNATGPEIAGQPGADTDLGSAPAFVARVLEARARAKAAENIA